MMQMGCDNKPTRAEARMAATRPGTSYCSRRDCVNARRNGLAFAAVGGLDVRLTLHTDYSLRLLMLLALEPGGLHTIADVAQRYGISRNHLMKVAQTLIGAGFVESVRGRHGGLKLAMAPEKIVLGAVVRKTEDGFTMVECFDRKRCDCIVASVCGLRKPLEEALDAFLSVLDGYTLAEIIRPHGKGSRLRRLLEEAAPA